MDIENTRTRDYPRVNRLLISRKDIETAIEFAAAAACEDFAKNLTVQRALITAAIIAYVRPFSRNYDHPEAVGHLEVPLDSLTEEEHKLHNKLMTIRDKAIAHSDFEMNPVRLIMCDDGGDVTQHRMYDPLSESPEISRIDSLAKKVGTEIRRALHALGASRPTQ